MVKASIYLNCWIWGIVWQSTAWHIWVLPLVDNSLPLALLAPGDAHQPWSSERVCRWEDFPPLPSSRPRLHSLVPSTLSSVGSYCSSLCWSVCPHSPSGSPTGMQASQQSWWKPIVLRERKRVPGKILRGAQTLSEIIFPCNFIPRNYTHNQKQHQILRLQEIWPFLN